eukprot:14786229-Alexandrium_andersonii.AAC.1
MPCDPAPVRECVAANRCVHFGRLARVRGRACARGRAVLAAASKASGLWPDPKFKQPPGPRKTLAGADGPET